jgi:hypothetical protein
MTTPDMINLIRANTQPLSQKTLQTIADRLEEQHAYLRSCLCTIDVQEEQPALPRRRTGRRASATVRC